MAKEQSHKVPQNLPRNYVADQRGLQDKTPKASLSNTYPSSNPKPDVEKQRPIAPAPGPANPGSKPSQQTIAPIPKPATLPPQNPKKS